MGSEHQGLRESGLRVPDPLEEEEGFGVSVGRGGHGRTLQGLTR